MFLIILDHSSNTPYFFLAVSLAPLKSEWREPEFGLGLVALNMNVWRFVAVACKEKEPVWTEAKGRGHLQVLPAGIEPATCRL
jgi:hypothetical protein